MARGASALPSPTHPPVPFPNRMPLVRTPLGLTDAVEAFVLSRVAAGCSKRTTELYSEVLNRFANEIGPTVSECTTVAVQSYIGKLRTRVASTTVQLHTCKIRAFLRWLVEMQQISADPLRGFRLRVSQPLRRVPDDDMVARLLLACPPTFEGRRNRALVSLLADAGLRISEALSLRTSDVDFGSGTIFVCEGKGQKGGIGFFGRHTGEYLQAWLASRTALRPEDHLFCDRRGRPLSRRQALKILHTLSDRAHLAWKISPHQLRRFAATALLRRTGDLELTRRVMRHATLSTTLLYASLSLADVQKKFRNASPIDNLGATGTPSEGGAP